MALQPNTIPLSFSQGIDTKTDSKQVIPGKLLTLQNGIFQTRNSIRKRNGYLALGVSILTGGSIAAGMGLATFQNQLNLFDGSNFYSYNSSLNNWSQKSSFPTLNVSSTSIIQNNNNQTSPDSAFNASGLSTYVWEDSSGGCRYSVIDTATGQPIVSNSLLSSTGANPRVASVGNFFAIFYVDSNQIKIQKISTSTPQSITSATSVTTDLNASNQLFDLSVVNSKIFLGYTNTGTGISFYSFDTSLTQSAQKTVGTDIATAINLFGDASNNVWCAYYTGSSVKTLIVNNALNTTILAPTIVETVASVRNITGTTISTTGQIFYEISGSQAYNNFIRINTITVAGSVGTAKNLIRSLGLASKSFTYNSSAYVLGTYSSTLQGKYFLLNQSGQVCSRISGEPNLGGGLTAKSLLPSVNVISADTFQFSFLQVDSTSFTAVSNAGSIVEKLNTQTGIVQASILFNTGTSFSSLQLGSNLNISGGLPSIYDGNNLTEQGFNLYPENIVGQLSSIGGALSNAQYQYAFVYEWIDNQGQKHRSAPSIPITIGSPTNSTVLSSTTITSGSNSFNLVGPGNALTLGMSIVNPTYFPAGTYLTNISNAATFNSSQNSLSSAHPANLTLTPGYTWNGVSITAGSNIIVLPQVQFVNQIGTIQAGSNILTVQNPQGLSVGLFMTCSAATTLPTTTKITAINGNQITLNNNSTNTATNGSFLFQKQITGNISSGSPTISGISAGDIATLQVGDTLFSPTLFAAGTTILSISVSSITVSTNALSTATATTIVTGLASTFPLIAGQALVSTDLPTTATIVSVVGSNVTISQPSLNTSTTSIVSMTQVNAASLTIPTLRVTSKSSPVGISIYRTQGNQSVFFKVGQVVNDPTVDSVSYVDLTPDVNILSNEQLYTTGGVVENFGAPPTNITTIYKNRQIVVPSENPLTWWYSKQVVPDSPVEFSDVFVNNIDQRGGNITAIGVMDEKLVFFKPNLIFFTVGDGPASNGTNNDFQEPLLIPSDVGCVNQKSVISVPQGIFFQGTTGGIYLLSREGGVIYIGAEVEAFNANTVTSVQLISSVNQARFTLNNGTALVYDYLFNQWSVFTNHSAVDSIMFQNTFTYMQSNGTVLKETVGQYQDNGAFIPLSLTTSWLSFAGLQGFQRVWDLELLGAWKSAHTLNVSLAYDFGGVSQTDNIPVLSSITPYQFRIRPNRQKCQTIQLTISDTQSGGFGEGMSLSGFNFLVGAKRGLNKVPASSTFG